MVETKQKKRGFAAMAPEKRRVAASRGGKNCHANGNGHQWSHEEAVLAGRKGGAKTAVQRRGEKLP